MNNCKIYVIKALTNMHVGSGDINFNIIDNEVQRDVITNYPTINSSSLKGAIREFFKNKLEGSNEDIIQEIFGDENKGAGAYKFFSGMLLSIPVRSNKKQFFRATSPRIIKEFLQFAEDFSIELDIKDELDIFSNLIKKGDKPRIFQQLNDVKIENFHTEINNDLDKDSIEKLEKLFGEDIVLFNDDDFQIVINELPVIARNKLDNGKSENLWYEEVVPRESRFYFGILQGEKYQDQFLEILTNDLVQIGANSSIGYGYTRIQDLFKIVGDNCE